MQNTTEQKLVMDGPNYSSNESVTTAPEPGLKQKVKALLSYNHKGRRRTAQVVATIDTGQMLYHDGVISKVAWETMLQPELEPSEGTVATAAHDGVMNKVGVVSERANMIITMGNKSVAFRPLVLDQLSHSLNIGAQFLEKLGFVVDCANKKLYSVEHRWEVPFTCRRDHIALTVTRRVFEEQHRTICNIDATTEVGWGQLPKELDKQEFNDKEWESVQKESLGFPLSSNKWVQIPERCGQMVRVHLPPGVRPQEQWLVEPLQEEDKVGVPLGVVKANAQSNGRVLAVYVYNSTNEPALIAPGIPIGRALRAEVLPAGSGVQGECLEIKPRPEESSAERVEQIWKELELEENEIF